MAQTVAVNPSLKRLLALVVLTLAGMLASVGSGGGGGGGGGDATNHPPIAAFTTEDVRETDNPPITVDFSAAAASDPDGRIVSYKWDFGDGTTAAGESVSHTFTARGGFDVRLTVTDDDGATDTATQVDFVVIGPRFGIDGVMSSALGSAVDTDVNDPAAPYSSNDQVAQPAPNPGLIGGYASWDGTGYVEDRFGAAADVYDRFAPVPDLVAGERITLWIADHNSQAPNLIDLDLYLCARGDTDCPREGGAIVGPLNDAAIIASSVGVASTESFVVPSTGSYDLVVEGYEGFSNYVLAVGEEVSVDVPGPATLKAEDDFVPGEVIVRFKPDPAALPAAVRIDALGLVRKAGQADGHLLLRMGDEPEAQRALQALGVGTRRVNRPTATGLSEDGRRSQLRDDTLHLVKALRARDDVLSADLNYIRRASLVPSDPRYASQWHYPLINLPNAWELTTDANGDVVVAVVDTGVLVAHPDLSAKLTPTGYDFVSDPLIAADGDGIDDDPNDPGDSAAGGSSFHGTHVAGTVAASTDNDVGVAGVSWGSRIMAVRALGLNGVGTSYDIIQAIRYAAGLSNDANILLGPEQRADIINLSLGGPAYSSSEQTAFDEVRGQGVIVVAAAGNDGSNALNYPASYDGVLSVAAVDCTQEISSFSNYGGAIDLAAPGGDLDLPAGCASNSILSTVGDDLSGPVQFTYAGYVGTSMAAPHVSGVLALMKSVYPGLTPAEVDALLASGTITEDSGSDGATVRNNSYGYGLIDALAAVQQAVRLSDPEQTLPAVLSAAPNTLRFSLTTNTEASGAVTVSNLGEEALSVTDVQIVCDAAEDTGCMEPPNVPWLGVSYLGAAADGLGQYQVTAQRGLLEDGVYTASVVFAGDNGQSVRIGVSLSVGLGAAANGDAGRQYILLLDAETYEPQQQFEANPDAGSYSYAFTGVPVGKYVILSGTDLDNDFIICDPGEACGGWLQVEALANIDVIDSDVSGLNFETGFRILPSTAALREGWSGVSRLVVEGR